MPDKKLKYKTGEVPQYGDLIRGCPNHSEKIIAGVMIAGHDGTICILYLRPTGMADSVRLYGEAQNFELLARNEID